MNNKKYLSLALLATGLFGLVAISPVLAETTNGQSSDKNDQGNTQRGVMMRGINVQNDLRQNIRPAVAGTVTAVSGNTITITAKQGFGMMGRGEKASTTNPAIKTVIYTVDATNAKVVKNNATSTVSAIVVGDTVLVQGTITGTNIIATNIRDGLMMNRGKDGQENRKLGTSTPPFVGNGQPVIAGAVSAINGNSLTVTTGNNVVYTVDVTNAKFTQGPNSITLANVFVGDRVVVQGSVNGTAVVASSIIDQKVNANNENSNNQNKPKPGFFGRIGGFFSHMFGF